MNKKTKDLWKMSDGELEKAITESKEILFKHRFQKVVEENPDTTTIRKTKCNIARMKTILHLKKTGKAPQSE